MNIGLRNSLSTVCSPSPERCARSTANSLFRNTLPLKSRKQRSYENAARSNPSKLYKTGILSAASDQSQVQHQSPDSASNPLFRNTLPLRSFVPRSYMTQARSNRHNSNKTDTLSRSIPKKKFSTSNTLTNDNREDTQAKRIKSEIGEARRSQDLTPGGSDRTACDPCAGDRSTPFADHGEEDGCGEEDEGEAARHSRHYRTALSNPHDV